MLTMAPLAANAGLLGSTVTDAQSAVYESQARLVASSQIMNTAEEVKIVAPTSEADATVKIAALDDKADSAKDLASAAFDKAAEYLAKAQDSTSATVKSKYVAAADTYEKTAYFYSVTADLYLSAQVKTSDLAAALPEAPTSQDNAANITVVSAADAKLALTEAKAAVAVQKNASELVADAASTSVAVGTSSGVTQAKSTVQGLEEAVVAKKEVITDLVTEYQAKAAAAPAGAVRDAYTAVVTQYQTAASIADSVVTTSQTATARFTNAVPENPVNPGDNLKWHIFQSNPNTALAVMKYNFAQFAFSAIHWQGMTQSIAQDPDYYLNPANHQETINEYVNGFRSSSLQVALEAKDLRALVARYNDQIAGATDADAAIWKQVSSYLVDIITVYDEIAQSQYQIYTTLSESLNVSALKASLVTQTAEVKSVLKAGEKVVTAAGELSTKATSGRTEIDVYTTAPQEKVTVSLAKSGAKTITATDVTDASGLAEVNLTKDYAGYTASVYLDGKLVDKEKVTK